MLHVFLNPDGTQKLGLFVIVEHPTGVTYAQQCAGFSNDLRTIEGFLIPVADRDDAQRVFDWFWARFRGNCYPNCVEWTDEFISQLRELVAQIPCWMTHSDGPEGVDQRLFLQLDLDRINECVEAWVPVITPYGRGILTFENSD